MPAGDRLSPTGCPFTHQGPTRLRIIQPSPKAFIQTIRHRARFAALVCRNQPSRKKACLMNWQISLDKTRSSFASPMCWRVERPPFVAKSSVRVLESRPVSRRCAQLGPKNVLRQRHLMHRTPPESAVWVLRVAGTVAGTRRCPIPRPSNRAFKRMVRLYCTRGRWISAKGPIRSLPRSLPRPLALTSVRYSALAQIQTSRRMRAKPLPRVRHSCRATPRGCQALRCALRSLSG